MIPTFAVVGHPNKGKSSIVATLAEDERIAIAPDPGTTRAAHRYTLSIDGDPQYVLVDTPGFQRARAVLEWLEERTVTANERPALVARFVEEHGDDDRFHDECELLRPIVGGAGILYVVDGAKPYGPEYELEMQVLQWTGRPRMALINLIGEGDYVEQWRQGLGQYFSIVRVFDAVRADFSKRLALLRAFAELDEDWRPAIERAVRALTAERERRRQRAGAEITDMIAACLSLVERAPFPDVDSERRAAVEARLTDRLRDRIRDRERQARDRVQGSIVTRVSSGGKLPPTCWAATSSPTKDGICSACRGASSCCPVRSPERWPAVASMRCSVAPRFCSAPAWVRCWEAPVP